MSAYTDGRPVPVNLFGKMSPDARDITPPDTSSGAADRLEGFVLVMRQLESSLAQERSKYKKVRDEWSEAHALYQQSIKDAESRIRELSFQEGRHRAQIKQYEEHDGEIKTQINTLKIEFNQAKEELRKYQQAWSDVLQREREAKMVILESQNTKKAAADLDVRAKQLEEQLTSEKAAREQMERHSRSYQLELQNALVRLHSSEAKFSELTKEIQALQKSRKSIDEEVARVERSMKERFKWEATQEIERNKAEVAKAAADDREKFREELRSKVQTQVDETITHERQRLLKMREQYEQERAGMRAAMEAQRNELTEKLAETQRDGAAARAELSHMREASARSHRELEVALEQERRESALEKSRLEDRVKVEREKGDSIQAHLETARRDMASEKRVSQGRVSELEGKLARNRKRLQVFVGACRKRLARIRQSLKGEQALRAADGRKWTGLEKFVLQEKGRFDETLVRIELEIDSMRAQHPLRDLIKQIQGEIERIEDPAELEEMMRYYAETQERIAQAEATFDEQIETIREARAHRTFIAGPAS